MSIQVVLMGTGPFAVPSFEAIRAAGYPIAHVITRPPAAVKSRKGPPPAPVRRWAETHSLPLALPASVNEADGVELLSSFAADLLVVCDYGEILRPEALATTPLGGINLHGSLLPAYRGAAPVQRALLAGERETGVTVIHMTPRLDGGPILATRSTEIRETETAGELEERLAALGVDATLEAIELLKGWDRRSEIGQPQDPDRVSRAPRLRKAEGEIDWGWTTRQVDCHIRGMQPWPGAFTFLHADANKPPLRVAIRSARPVDVPPSDRSAPGERLGQAGLVIATGDGAVEVETLQPSGRRAMSGEEFVRGHARADLPLRFGLPGNSRGRRR